MNSLIIHQPAPEVNLDLKRFDKATQVMSETISGLTTAYVIHKFTGLDVIATGVAIASLLHLREASIFDTLKKKSITGQQASLAIASIGLVTCLGLLSINENSLPQLLSISIPTACLLLSGMHDQLNRF